MAQATFKIPTSAAEEAEAEKALTLYRRSRVQAVADLLAGPEAAAFEAALAAVVSGGFPVGTSVAINIPQLPTWFSEVRVGCQADLDNLDRLLTPPTPAEPSEVAA